MAKSNAGLNKIRASFQSSDVHKWNSTQNTDVIAANLYSDLLIEILPKLNAGAWLILSGVLRSQEHEFLRALPRNHINVISMKRRGKWIAFWHIVVGCSVRCPQRIDPAVTLRSAKDSGLYSIPDMEEFLRRSWTAATVKIDAN